MGTLCRWPVSFPGCSKQPTWSEGRPPLACYMPGLGKSPGPLEWCTSLSMLVYRALSNSPETSMGFALLKEQVHLLSLLRKGWHQLLRTFILVRSYFCNVTPGIGPISGAEQQRRVRWWPRDHGFCQVFPLVRLLVSRCKAAQLFWLRTRSPGLAHRLVSCPAHQEESLPCSLGPSLPLGWATSLVIPPTLLSSPRP